MPGSFVSHPDDCRGYPAEKSPPMEKPGANEKRSQVRAAPRERMAEVASQKCYRIRTRLYIGNQVPVARLREATSPRAVTEERNAKPAARMRELFSFSTLGAASVGKVTFVFSLTAHQPFAEWMELRRPPQRGVTIMVPRMDCACPGKVQT